MLRPTCSTASRGQLSGGQRQRVAIGRAIVPRAGGLPRSTSRFPIWMPNCVSSCGSKSPNYTSGSATTMIYVTHDQIEAMTMADKIVVLRKRRDRAGRSAAGPLQPSAQYLRCRASSAHRRMNFINGTIAEDGGSVDSRSGRATAWSPSTGEGRLARR
ncbi:hypothetical protein OKA06_19070 [Novosphingobium sp. MW5]|nr:hypothetical protein [Novosphingobium sp. MW5]